MLGSKNSHVAVAPPLVSFVIPAYNAERTLPRTIASVAKQAVKDWEAIIVDDGSTDDPAGVATRLAQSDPRIKFLTRKNGGPSAARNTGIAAARGEWLVFLDADDTISPSFLARMVGAV